GPVPRLRGGPHASLRRPAPGPAAELRLRTPGTDRSGWRDRDPPGHHHGRELTMATKKETLDSVRGMTVLELSELLKDFGERFGVTAAAPVAVAAPGGGPADAPVEEEKDEFDVVLVGGGGQKIAVIKEGGPLTTPAPKEAKARVGSAPKAVLEKVNKDEAEKARAALGGAGATVELK